MNDTLRQNEQQKLATDKEIERLTLPLTAQDNTNIEYEEKWALCEQKFSMQLLAIQQQAEQEKAEQARTYNEKEQTLHHQHAEREHVLNQQLQERQEELRHLEQDRAKREKILLEQTSLARQELENLLHTLAQREQEFSVQLLEIQRQAKQEKSDQALTCNEQERTLHHQYAEREHALNQQLQTGQEELRRLKQNWVQHEKALNKKIDALQSEKQELDRAQQLQTQNHQSERKALLDQLKAEILSEQQTNLRLRQSLTEVQRNFEAKQLSLPWRMPAPLCMLASLIATKKDSGPASPMTVENEPTHEIMSSMKRLQSLNLQHTSIMLPPVQTTNLLSSIPVATLDELLTFHDQRFVRLAYQTLLGREPDPEGLDYYIRRLHRGFAKIGVLKQIHHSKEGQEYAANLPGLDKAIQRFQRRQYPLIGWLFKQGDDEDSNHTTARKLRSIENHIFLLSEESKRRFNQFETALAGLHYLVEQQTQSIEKHTQSIEKHTQSIEKQTQSIEQQTQSIEQQTQSIITAQERFAAQDQGRRPLKTPYTPTSSNPQLSDPDDYNQVSPRVRAINSQIKTAVSTYAGRIA